MYWLYYVSGIIVIPAIIYSVYVGRKVNSTFKEYSNIASGIGMTASQVARQVLNDKGLYNVEVLRTRGNLTDHYDPKSNAVYLSDSVHDSISVAAIGVAIHECGHAMQASEGYLPYRMRMSTFPIANIGSRLAIPLIFIGMLLDSSLMLMGDTTLGFVVMIVGLIFYSFSTLFTFITLPVEFNASRRAKEILSNMIPYDELEGCSAVLDAATKTYVASFAVSLMQLFRLLLIVGSRRK